MKGILLTGIIILVTGCCSSPGYVEYTQVAVAPAPRLVVTPPVVAAVPVVPVVTRVINPVVQPVTVDYVEPLDVTTTTIDFY